MDRPDDSTWGTNVTYDTSNVFAKILRGEILAPRIFEDDRCIVIRDISPRAPTHLLVIPKGQLINVVGTSDEDALLLGHLLVVAARVAKSEGIGDGFRLVVNNGESAGQSVFHLHVHVMGGRPLSWPPG